MKFSSTIYVGVLLLGAATRNVATDARGITLTRIELPVITQTCVELTEWRGTQAHAASCRDSNTVSHMRRGDAFVTEAYDGTRRWHAHSSSARVPPLTRIHAGVGGTHMSSATTCSGHAIRKYLVRVFRMFQIRVCYATCIGTEFVYSYCNIRVAYLWCAAPTRLRPSQHANAER